MASWRNEKSSVESSTREQALSGQLGLFMEMAGDRAFRVKFDNLRLCE